MLVVLAWAAPPARAVAPLHDPVALNIGVNCQWQKSCERRQARAMREARRYIASNRPPLWRIHLCNRNSARGLARIDWVGFNQCIRNPNLRAPRSARRAR